MATWADLHVLHAASILRDDSLEEDARLLAALRSLASPSHEQPQGTELLRLLDVTEKINERRLCDNPLTCGQLADMLEELVPGPQLS